jgi:hypothetical protein
MAIPLLLRAKYPAVRNEDFSLVIYRTRRISQTQLFGAT